MATLTELNVNRVSNIMSARTLNTKQKKMLLANGHAGEIRVKRISRASSCKVESSFKLLITPYFLSQSDSCGTLAVKLHFF